MPEHGFEQVAGAAIVEELGMAADRFGQAYAPQRRGSPVLATGEKFRAVVCQARPHVVQQQVGVRPDHLVGLFGFGGMG
ncbi:hypothetical protein D9M71_392100 [compost metagenome]